MAIEKEIFNIKPDKIIILPHLFLMFVLIGLFTIWKPLFSVLTTKLVLTNKRISGKTGLIKTEVMDSPLSQITSIKVSQGLMGKIFNYATLIINTAMGTYEFNCIPNAENVKNTIFSNINLQDK